MRAANSLPGISTGTLTFLLTDIEGSTRLWEQHPQAMAVAHAHHSRIIAAAVAAHGGTLVRERGEGDSTFSVFPQAPAALQAAGALQRMLSTGPWPPEAVIRVRAALHTGTALASEGDYNSSDVNRCARLRAIAHGGQTLLSATTYQLVRDHLPDEYGLTDLGLHRLKDLSRPEQVYQLLHVDLPSSFPPLVSLDVSKTNLPVQTTSFVGREQEMAEIERLLNTHRLVTVLGPGGSGKTRLTLQVAAEVSDAFPDGVWLVELVDVSEPDLLPQSVAAALGVREEPDCMLLRSLIDHLRPRMTLLILDNCEQLVEACAGLVDTLLRGCPQLRIFVTSQQALGVRGAARYRLPPMSLPSGALQAKRWLHFDAVRLFVERAQLARPGFRLEVSQADVVARICRRLAGLPLAIELAAAWADMLTLPAIDSRLDDMLRLLARANTTAPLKHRTLRAALDYSYGMLGPAEQTLFARLSIFAGGWTLEAAEAVCGGDGVEATDVLAILSHLYDKSLVTADEQEGEMRYGFLEPIRQYSQERLREEAQGRNLSEDALRRRHLDAFLRLGEAAESSIDGSEEAVWSSRLETERGNVRQALEWALDRDLEACLRLAGAVYWFWFVRGYHKEWRAWLASALDVQAQVSGPVRLKALTGAGILAYSEGDHDAAWRFYNAALAIQTERGDRPGIASLLNNLAMLEHERGHHAAARPLYEEALEIYRSLDDRQNAGKVLCNLGALLTVQGEHEQAYVYLEDSLHIMRHMQNSWAMGVILENMGRLARRQGDLAQAKRHLRESLRLRGQHGDRSGLAKTLLDLAIVLHAEDEPFLAAQLLAASTTFQESVGVPLSSIEQSEYERVQTDLRAILDAEAFARQWDAGAGLSAEQVDALLSETD